MLKDWKQIVSYRFPRLSLPQISGLATVSFWDGDDTIEQSNKSFDFNSESQSGTGKYGTSKIKRVVQRRESQDQKKP